MPLPLRGPVIPLPLRAPERGREGNGLGPSSPLSALLSSLFEPLFPEADELPLFPLAILLFSLGGFLAGYKYINTSSCANLGKVKDYKCNGDYYKNIY